MPAGWYLEPGEHDPTTKILVGVVAVGAIALGIVFATKGGDDDEKASKPADTTVAVTTTGAGATTTIAGTTTTIAGSTTTTAGEMIDGATLVGAMPTAAETPSGWDRYREPEANPAEDNGSSYCNMPTEPERARALGLQALARGPAYGLPQGGWFTFDIFAFETDEAANNFLRAVADDANMCTDVPVNYTESESDADYMDESWGDFDWTVEEAAGASEVSIAGDEALVRTTVQQRYSATVDGVSLQINRTFLVVYERYGRVVVEYWVGGDWNFVSSDPEMAEPDYAHQPVQSDLDDAVDAIRESLRSRLRDAGAT